MEKTRKPLSFDSLQKLSHAREKANAKRKELAAQRAKDREILVQEKIKERQAREFVKTVIRYDWSDISLPSVSKRLLSVTCPREITLNTEFRQAESWPPTSPCRCYIH